MIVNSEFTVNDIAKYAAKGFDVNFVHVHGNTVVCEVWYVKTGRNLRIYSGDNVHHAFFAVDAFLESLE